MEEKKLRGPQGIMSIPSDCLVLKNVFDSTKAKVYDFFCDTKDWYTCDNGQSHHCKEFFFFFFLLMIIVLLSIVRVSKAFYNYIFFL